MSQISGPVSNTVEPNLAYLKGKSVIITGGMIAPATTLIWNAVEY
jgi:hypothetical protein